MPVSPQQRSATARATPVLKVVGKLVLLTALRYGPAGVAGWAIKSVARRPAKMLLALTLKPALDLLASKLATRVNKRTPPSR